MDGIVTLLYIVLMLVTVVSAIFYVINRVGAASHYRQFKKTQKPVRELTEAERNLLEVHYSQRLRDNGVYALDGFARVMTLSTNGSTERHLTIDGVDIRMFPHWEALADAGVNRVLVAIPRRTAELLPLEFNGVSLAEAQQLAAGTAQEADAEQGDTTAAPAAASADTVTTGIAGSRMETKTESALRQVRASANVGWAIGLCIGLLFILLTSRLPGQGQLLALPFVALCLFSGWQLLAHWQTPRAQKPGKLHELVGELNDCEIPPEPGNGMRFAAARIGSTDAYYPKLWLPLIKQQADGMHQVEIDMKHQVVRHDGLSLYDTLRAHPQPRWGRYLVIVLGSAALLAVALLFDPSPIDTLTVASRQLDGESRQLRASSPEALLAQNPQPGDWITLSGVASCMTESAYQNAPINTIDRGERLECNLLGWNNTPLDIGKLDLTTQEVALVGLLHQLRSDHRLFEHDYDYAQPFADRGNKLGQFELRDLSRLVLALDSVCHDGGRACANIELHMIRIVDGNQPWQALLAQAQQGDLPRLVEISRKQLSDLGDFLYPVLRYRVRSAAQHQQYKNTLASYTPAMVLQRLNLAFFFSSGSYGEGPFTRHVTSPAYSSYVSAATRRSLAELNRRLRMERVRERRHNPRTTTQKLMNIDFRFSGRIRRIGTYQGLPMLTLQHNDDFEPPSLFHLATAPLLALFSVLFGAFGLIGFIATRRRKSQRDAAVRTYIEKRLQRSAP